MTVYTSNELALLISSTGKHISCFESQNKENTLWKKKEKLSSVSIWYSRNFKPTLFDFIEETLPGKDRKWKYISICKEKSIDTIIPLIKFLKECADLETQIDLLRILNNSLSNRPYSFKKESEIVRKLYSKKSDSYTIRFEDMHYLDWFITCESKYGQDRKEIYEEIQLEINKVLENVH